MHGYIPRWTIWSPCFWVALWSVLFNEDHEQLQSIGERNAKEMLAKAFKDSAIERFNLEHDRNDITRHVRPVLMGWWEKVRSKNKERRDGVVRCVLTDHTSEEYYLLRFHRFSLQGAVDILEAFSVYWDGGIGRESWTEPGQPGRPH